MRKKVWLFVSLLMLLSPSLASPLSGFAKTNHLIGITQRDASVVKENKNQKNNEEKQSLNREVSNASDSDSEKAKVLLANDNVFNIDIRKKIEKQARAPEAARNEATRLSQNLNERGVLLFKGMQITDSFGNEFTEENPAQYNSNIKIHIDWALEDEEDISAGDYYTYQLPEYFAIHNIVGGDLQGVGGAESLGTFSVNQEGLLTVVFNSKATDLAKRLGTIDLETNLEIKTVTEELVIDTQIFDSEFKEIQIKIPVYQIDILKKGYIHGEYITWDIIFNEQSQQLTNVILTEIMPEGLSYNSYSLKGYIWNEALKKWEERTNLYTFIQDPSILHFDAINTPIKISINTRRTDLAITSFTNKATISGDQFLEKSVEATVSLDESMYYKEFIEYNQLTGETTWEIKASFSNAKGSILDKTFSGSDPTKAIHYLVEESIQVTRTDGESLSEQDGIISQEDTLLKENKKVQFKWVFENPGTYVITYKTKLFEPLFAEMSINNYMTIKDGENEKNDYGSGRIKPTETIGVSKDGKWDVENLRINWTIILNSKKKTIQNVRLADRYQQVSGKNQSWLTLIEETLEVKVGSTVLKKDVDYTLEILKEETSQGISFEPGFNLVFIKDYESVADEITLTYQTKFDWRKHTEILGADRMRLSNLVIADYEIEGKSYTEGKEKELWMQGTWTNNASKGGFFLEKGGSVTASLKKYLSKEQADTIKNPFGEEMASQANVYWIAVLNTLKEKLASGYRIVEQLGEGQTLQDFFIYETELTTTGTDIHDFARELKNGTDYKYEIGLNGEIVITLLKETEKTLAIALIANAHEDQFRYKNKATLKDDQGKEVVYAEGEVQKSAKDRWLSKEGIQNQENNRIVDWQVVINKDARTINEAVVKDTIKFNQQTFVVNDTGQITLRMYKAVAVQNDFVKGEEITDGFVVSLERHLIDGTQSMKIVFDSAINGPYILAYQTQLDSGILNQEKISNDVTLTGKGTEIHQVTREIEIKYTGGSGTSTGVDGALIIHKIDEDTKESIDLATFFDLYKLKSGAENEEDENYEIYLPNIEVKNNKIVTENGPVKQLKNLRYGKYGIKEKTPPEGYVQDDTMYKFKIDESQKQYTFTLTNKKTGLWELVAEKYDAYHQDKKLSDSKFLVVEYETQWENPTKSAEIDGNQLTSTYSLAPGFYSIQESKAPVGYILDETAYKFEVKLDGSIQPFGSENLVKEREKPKKDGWYLDPDQRRLIFVKYDARKGVIPATGGEGYRQFIVGALIFGSLASVVGIYSSYRSKKEVQ